MKILFNCLNMGKGGAERVVSVLANEFCKEDEVCILTLMDDEDAYALDSNIKRICVDRMRYNGIRRKIRKLSLVRSLNLKKKIINESPDIIISFLPEPSLRLMLESKFSLKIRKIPKIISIRNNPVKEYGNPLVRFAVKKLYKNVDGIIYQTNDAKKYFKNIIKTKNQLVVQNPIDDSMFIDPKVDKERRNVIISVGRLESQKNHELLIRAFKRAVEDENNEFELEIYGEGSRRQYLQKLIDGLGLSSKVFLNGKVDNIVQKLNDSKIFVLSSHYEGMPNALMEAMAVGLPCISTDCPCGGPRELIKNNENGLLVSNEDEKDLSNAINKLMVNAKLREEISKKAILIRNTNNIKLIMEEWKKLINDIVRMK